MNTSHDLVTIECSIEEVRNGSVAQEASKYFNIGHDLTENILNGFADNIGNDDDGIVLLSLIMDTDKSDNDRTLNLAISY